MSSLQHAPDLAPGETNARGRLIRNAAWLIAERGIRFVVVFATGVLMTRHLGPSDAGALSNALALAAILGAFCDLGLDSVIRLKSIQTPAARGTILGSALLLRLITVPAAFTAFWWLLRDPTSVLDPGLVFGVGLTLCYPAVLVFDSWFHSQTKAKYSVWAQTAALTLGATLRVGAVMLDAPVGWFGWIAGIETISAGVFLALIYRSVDASKPRWNFGANTAKELLTDAWSLALTNVAILIYTRIDVVMLTALRTPYETGLYAAAVRLIEFGYIIPMILVNTLFPTLARLHATDPAGFQRVFQRLLATVAWGGIATAAVLGLGSRNWIEWIYGSSFAAAAPVLAIGAASCVFAGLGAVRSQWLLLNGLQHYGLYYVSLGAGLSFALNGWLIPQFGALGAASASLVTQIFIVLVAPLFFTRTRPSVPLLLRAFIFDGAFYRVTSQKA